MFVYKNGVHYIDSLQDAVESQGDEKGNKSDEIYISIPDDKWDEFADEFSVQVYNNKADYKRNSLIITVLLALLGGVVTYFISGHFNQRRKTLANGLNNFGGMGLTKEQIQQSIEALGVPVNVRGEALSLAQFAQLSNIIGAAK